MGNTTEDKEKTIVDTIIKEYNKPEDIIIQSIREQLHSGELQPGMRLPAERKLVERYNVSRTHVREALRKLESYGIIETRPQSGSVIVGIGITALDGLLSDVLRLNEFDFAALAEMRVILEVNSARLCAERRTEEELRDIEAALQDYQTAYTDQQSDEINAKDFQLHRSIARGAQNSVLSSMMMLITPDITEIYHRENVCVTLDEDTYNQHCELVRLIREQKADEAADLMQLHLTGMLKYAQKLRK